MNILEHTFLASVVPRYAWEVERLGWRNMHRRHYRHCPPVVLHHKYCEDYRRYYTGKVLYNFLNLKLPWKVMLFIQPPCIITYDKWMLMMLLSCTFLVRSWAKQHKHNVCVCVGVCMHAWLCRETRMTDDHGHVLTYRDFAPHDPVLLLMDSPFPLLGWMNMWPACASHCTSLRWSGLLVK